MLSAKPAPAVAAFGRYATRSLGAPARNHATNEVAVETRGRRQPEPEAARWRHQSPRPRA